MASALTKPELVWHIAGGNGSRQGLFHDAVRLQSRPLRQLQAQGSVQAATVFDTSGRAFVADMSGAVQAFLPGGDLLWRVEVPGGISATPAIHPAKPILFIGTHQGWVCALATESGATLWRKSLPTSADPRILSDLLCLPDADQVVLSSWGGRFQALDATSGAEQFSWTAGISPGSAAALDADGLIYSLRAVADQGIQFVRTDAEGRETILHQSPEPKNGARRTLVSAGPVLDEERGLACVLLNGNDGCQLLAWSLKTGRVGWTHTLPNAVQAPPAIRKDGVIVVADLKGMVHAVAPDGTLQFRYQTGNDYLLSGAVAEAGGTAFLGDPVGVLHQIAPNGKGHAVFEAERAIQARPSFDPQGNLYVPTTGHRVLVFGRATHSASKSG